MASSDCLNASGEASCIKTREWGGPPARIRRKYRRLEASPARGATVASLTRKGSLVLTVSVTTVGSGEGGAFGESIPEPIAIVRRHDRLARDVGQGGEAWWRGQSEVCRDAVRVFRCAA